MKTILSTFLLSIVLILNFTQAQNIQFTQTRDAQNPTPIKPYFTNTNQFLNVYHENELLFFLSTPNIHDIKESGEWRNLLNSFLSNLENVKAKIPDYSIYKIEYQKDYNLIVEEVEGIVKYKVEMDQTNYASNQSLAILRSRNQSIHINFGSLEDLFSIEYEDMIASALGDLEKKPGTFKRAYFPKYNYNYSYSKKEMMDSKKDINWNFVIPVIGTIGIFRAKPIYETGVGLGFSRTEKQSAKYSAIYLSFSTAFQYNEETQEMNASMLAGIAFKFKQAGTLSIAFPLDDTDGIYNNIDARIGGTIELNNFLAISVFSNIGSKEGESIIFPSMSIGYMF